jgi:hypothetical protein
VPIQLNREPAASQSVTQVHWLTVIIPSFRGERWIATALDSLAAEAAAGIEVLVIDSSPTDETREIARSYSDRLQLRVFERADLKSWHAKTNFGVEAANSAHICWLGVDDIWLSGRSQAVRAWIDVGPNVPLHLASSAILSKTGKRLAIWRCPLRTRTELSSESVIERLLIQNFIAAPAPVFRRDAWLACGGLDTDLWYTADWDMWLKLAARGPVRYHDEPTIGFRVHGDSLTISGSRDIADFESQMRTVLERHLEAYAGNRIEVARAARASIAVNCALALASQGDHSRLVAAAHTVLRLGPRGAHRYLRDSRIMERIFSRVRAKFTGAF